METKMKYDLDGFELDILLISLIGRRNNIKGLLTTSGMSESYYAGYREEMARVDGLLEKFFPGSVKSLEANAAAAA